MSVPLVLVHGGAGDVPEDRRERHARGCLEAARAGGAVLAAGGSAVEAAVAAVRVLEDGPVYNAGRGCALTRDGHVSLDAAVMDGATLEVGAVAVLPPFRNPVAVAHALLREPEVLLAGPEAGRWAEAHGFEPVPEDELITDAVRARLAEVLREGRARNFAGGTVGAVVRDAEGRLAAATSTGGTMGKAPGRIGDSPVVGAGTYACAEAAVSATGDGESFLRSVFAARLADAVAAGADPAAELRRRLEEARDRYAGLGGAILLTPEGPPLRDWTSRGMSHGWWSPEDEGCGI